MRRIIFFLYYRAGSTLFESLCNKSWRIAQMRGDIQTAFQLHQDWRATSKPFYLPSIPPCPSEDVSIPFMEAFEKYKDEPYYSYMMHIGDWWGQKKSKDIPEPFGDPTSQKWGPSELLALPELNTWRFIYLIRDGRGQIESLRSMKGGIEEQLNKEDPDDYFKVLCKSFRNKARLILETKKQLPKQTHIFYYKDLINNPIDTLDKMFTVGGLYLDKEKIPKLPTGDQHSSFGKVSLKDDKFNNWSKEEIDIFEEIAGKENKELGYI